jgi:hypothetical protein
MYLNQTIKANAQTDRPPGARLVDFVRIAYPVVGIPPAEPEEK